MQPYTHLILIVAVQCAMPIVIRAQFGALSVQQVQQQESCAIAKMTAQCALHMGALNIFGTP